MSLKQRSMVGTRSNRWTNRPQGSGNMKSGLPNALSSAGVGMMFGRTYRGGPPGLLANYKNKNKVFCINQMSGGVGAHGGGRSLFKMMDGTNCKGVGKDSPAPIAPTTLKWTCAGSSEKCVPDQTGTYATEQDCEKNCVPKQYKLPWTEPNGSPCSGMPPTDGGGGNKCTDYIQSNWPRAGGVLPADDLKDASNSCCKVYNTDKISCDICIDAAIPSGPTPPKTEPDPIIDAWCTDNHEMLFSECYIHAAMECKHNSNCTDDPAAAARRKCCGNEITPIVGDVCSPTSKGAWDGKFVRGQTGTLTDPGPFYLCNIWFPPPPLHDDAV